MCHDWYRRYFDATVFPVPLNIFEMAINRIMSEKSKAIRLRFEGGKRTLAWGQVQLPILTHWVNSTLSLSLVSLSCLSLSLSLSLSRSIYLIIARSLVALSLAGART